MRLRLRSQRLALAIVTSSALAATTAIAVLPPAQAATTDAGLFGAADPAYDGVFRQGLALTGLAAQGVTPPRAAIEWLLRQQCANGSFQAYRADVSVPCAAADPVNYTGPDTNQTAAALTALMALDDSSLDLPQALVNRVVTAADRAGAWLMSVRNRDGGWPYYAGGASDANSTGLALAAVLTQAPNRDIPAYRAASRFLGRLSGACPSGGLAYQPGSAPDALSTAQGLIGLAGPLPVTGPRRLAAAAPCANTSVAKATSYLARALSSTGVLPSSIGSGADYSTTATAVLGLVGAGRGRAAVLKSTAALTSAAAQIVGSGAEVNAGGAGLLLLVAKATGSKATSFGGVNLITAVTGSMRR